MDRRDGHDDARLPHGARRSLHPHARGTATILQGFTAKLEGGVIKADFTTTGMERDSEQGTLHFVAQPLKGYLFHRKI